MNPSVDPSTNQRSPAAGALADLPEPVWWPTDDAMAQARTAIHDAPGGGPRIAWSPPVPMEESPATGVFALPSFDQDEESGVADVEADVWNRGVADDAEALTAVVPPATAPPEADSYADPNGTALDDGMFRSAAPPAAQGVVFGDPVGGPVYDYGAPGPDIHPAVPAAPPSWMPPNLDMRGAEYKWDPTRSRNRSPVPLALGAAVLVMLAGIGTAGFLLFGGSSKSGHAQATSSPQPAVPVPASMLSAYEAQNVNLATFGGQVRVAWQAPPKTADVAGYIVVAQTPDGQILDRKDMTPADSTAVFSMPPVAADSCVVVTTLVKPLAGQTALQLAKGSAVCLNSSGTSQSPAQSSGG